MFSQKGVKPGAFCKMSPSGPGAAPLNIPSPYSDGVPVSSFSSGIWPHPLPNPERELCEVAAARRLVLILPPVRNIAA